MVVYEIKDPRAGPVVRPKPVKRSISPTVPVTESRAIDRLIKRQSSNLEGREKKRQRSMEPLTQNAAGNLRLMVDQVNSNLAACGIPIHLVIAKDDDGFAIDIYNCSDGEACRIIHDLNITVNELPSLLARLQQEAGLLVDRVM